MSSLVFVHGIGVRAPAGGGEHPYAATCHTIRFELALKAIGRTLVECSWGDDLGAPGGAPGQRPAWLTVKENLLEGLNPLSAQTRTI